MKIKKTILIILILIWMITVFIFSNQASTESSSTSGKVIEIIMKVLNIDISDEKIQELQLPIRKLAHFTIYAIGGLLITLLINQYNILTVQKIIYSQLFITIYAITDELHQYFIPGRAGCITDVLIDSAGGLFVILMCTYINSHIKRKKE